jgi:molybdopterin converting factor small subunit
MKTHIQLKLFANLQQFLPESADNFAIEAGTTIQSLLDMSHTLSGGERVGIFPPVGGG